MESYNFFIDREGRLRSGWRVAIFVVAFYICAQMGQAFLFASGRRVLGLSSTEMIRSEWSYVTGAIASAISALLVGWACGRLFEGLPFRALGCSRHRGWLKNDSCHRARRIIAQSENGAAREGCPVSLIGMVDWVRLLCYRVKLR